MAESLLKTEHFWRTSKSRREECEWRKERRNVTERKVF